jgi:hypothetical protein
MPRNEKGQEVEVVEAPALRHFRVTRYVPGDDFKVETIDLMAHSMQFTRGGDLLVVMYSPVDDGAALLTQYVRVFNHNHWIDYEELAVQKPSVLIS